MKITLLCLAIMLQLFCPAFALDCLVEKTEQLLNAGLTDGEVESICPGYIEDKVEKLEKAGLSVDEIYALVPSYKEIKRKKLLSAGLSIEEVDSVLPQQNVSVVDLNAQDASGTVEVSYGNVVAETAFNIFGAALLQPVYYVIFVDGEKVGTTPLSTYTIENLKPGKHDIRVSKRRSGLAHGAAPLEVWTESFYLNAGQLLELEL